MNYHEFYTWGGCAYWLSRTCTAPIERVKIILQTNKCNPAIYSNFFTYSINIYSGGEKISEVTSNNIRDYSRPMGVAKQIAKKQGVLSFWRGNTINMIIYFPKTAASLHLSGKVFEDLFSSSEFGSSKKVIKSFSAAAAAACAEAVMYPLKHVHTRLCADLGTGNSRIKPIEYITKVVKENGLQAIYHGVGVSFYATLLHRSAFLLFYNNDITDAMRDKNPFTREDPKLRVIWNAGVGQVAAVVAGLYSYPLDTIARKFQMQSDLPVSQRPIPSFRQYALKILKRGLSRDHYNGAGVNMIRYAAIGASYALYDELYEIFDIQSFRGY